MPELSRRGQERVSKIGGGLSIAEGYYDEINNPNGLINLQTAENSLMSEDLLKYIPEHFRLTTNHLKYRTSLVLGSDPSTKDALPTFLNRSLKPLLPITSKNTVVGPGLGAILAQLVWHLCNEGDGILLTAPYYADYPRDIIYPAKAVPVIVAVPADVDSLSPDVLPYIRETIVSYEQSGRTLGALLLNNPHNPIARAYDPATVRGYAQLAEEFDLHLIVDEVFANEVFSTSYVPQPAPFVSILSIDFAGSVDTQRIHVLAGPTKDFGASGIKAGALVTYNESVRRAVSDALSAIPISSAADALFTQIINDGTYISWFLEENRKRLGAALELLGHWCDFHQITFFPAQAGVFVLVDFERLITPLEGNGVDEKVDVFIARARKAGVRLRTPADHEDPIKTRFRVVFTLQDKIIKLALRRLEIEFGLSRWERED